MRFGKGETGCYSDCRCSAGGRPGSRWERRPNRIFQKPEAARDPLPIREAVPFSRLSRSAIRCFTPPTARESDLVNQINLV